MATRIVTDEQGRNSTTMANEATQNALSGEQIKNNITDKLISIFTPIGFEVYPFKIGWYNEQVGNPFKFSLHPDTLAYVLISTPQMFEKALIPFMCHDDCTGSLDLLDKCMKYHFSMAQKAFPDHDIESMHDFEMTPSRRPKILVQTAGHLAGATYYYTRKNLNPDLFGEKSVFGVCIHPKYGGWFALRGVFIFKSVLCPDLKYTEPIDCVPEQDQRVKLLDLFNFHWKDWRYRDIIDVQEKYSEDQMRYFETMPKDRKPLIEELREKYKKLRQENEDKRNTSNYHKISSQGSNITGGELCSNVSNKDGETMGEFY